MVSLTGLNALPKLQAVTDASDSSHVNLDDLGCEFKLHLIALK